MPVSDRLRLPLHLTPSDTPSFPPLESPRLLQPPSPQSPSDASSLHLLRALQSQSDPDLLRAPRSLSSPVSDLQSHPRLQGACQGIRTLPETPNTFSPDDHTTAKISNLDQFG